MVAIIIIIIILSSVLVTFAISVNCSDGGQRKLWSDTSVSLSQSGGYIR